MPAKIPSDIGSLEYGPRGQPITAHPANAAAIERLARAARSPATTHPEFVTEDNCFEILGLNARQFRKYIVPLCAKSVVKIGRTHIVPTDCVRKRLEELAAEQSRESGAKKSIASSTIGVAGGAPIMAGRAIIGTVCEPTFDQKKARRTIGGLRGLSADHKTALRMMASYANGGGVCWMPYAGLAKAADKSLAVMSAVVRRLEGLKLIDIIDGAFCFDEHSVLLCRLTLPTKRATRRTPAKSVTSSQHADIA